MLKELFHPSSHVVIGGGYASGPTLRMANNCIPTLIQEQTHMLD